MLDLTKSREYLVSNCGCVGETDVLTIGDGSIDDPIRPDTKYKNWALVKELDAVTWKIFVYDINE